MMDPNNLARAVVPRTLHNFVDRLPSPEVSLLGLKVETHLCDVPAQRRRRKVPPFCEIAPLL